MNIEEIKSNQKIMNFINNRKRITLIMMDFKNRVEYHFTNIFDLFIFLDYMNIKEIQFNSVGFEFQRWLSINDQSFHSVMWGQDWDFLTFKIFGYMK